MVAAEDSPGVHYDYGIIHRQGGTTAAAEADVLVTSAPISERQSPRASCSCLRSATASARVLQAAHIRPLPEGGEQRLDNGLLRAPAHCATQLGLYQEPWPARGHLPWVQETPGCPSWAVYTP